MKKILIFAGTTEGRTLSETLAASGIVHTVSVATEYGEMVMKEDPLVEIHRGRMDREEMEEFIKGRDFSVVVDATHPYAKIVTENIKAAANEWKVPYLRLRRETDEGNEDGDIRYFDSHEACACALKDIHGNILLTTGSKDLEKYSCHDELRDRLYARVLPGLESLEICVKNGICGKQIIALQGPFSTEMNEALIRQFDISCMVTKKSGKSGGYREKLDAAKSCGIPVCVIGQRDAEGAKKSGDTADCGDSFETVCQKLETLCGMKIYHERTFAITLAGIGMGNHDCMTKEVEEAIRTADILLGAERMIRPYTPKIDKKPYYKAEQILPYLEELLKEKSGDFVLEPLHVVILFSGDSGFYSGCPALYRKLNLAIEQGRICGTIKILPGISSISYLASCIGESYQDAKILSIHGRTVPNLAKKLAASPKTFLLTNGAKDIQALGKALVERGMESCEITAGVQLSYPKQKIVSLTPAECLEFKEEGLITCLVKNPEAKAGTVCHGAADGEFIREKVPMTKEEVREVSICKLKLSPDSIVYDVGSGTGSIAIEMAGLSDDIQVFAIERKPDAVSLIKRNQEKFDLENIAVVEAEAPAGLDELPTPTHAFIGGSGKKMSEILDALYAKNPSMRVVINAVTLETICELREILEQYPVTNDEIVQMQVSRTKKVGSYHMMQAENPVWICAFDFVPQEKL